MLNLIYRDRFFQFKLEIHSLFGIYSNKSFPIGSIPILHEQDFGCHCSLREAISKSCDEPHLSGDCVVPLAMTNSIFTHLGCSLPISLFALPKNKCLHSVLVDNFSYELI
jgi:hypothetical protein